MRFIPYAAALVLAAGADDCLAQGDLGEIVPSAYLKAADVDASDEFGTAVATSGDRIVVGAPLEDSGADEVNGDSGDNSLSNAGAAYVYVRSGSTWVLEAYLKAPFPTAGDRFGTSVATDGNFVVVGANGEGSASSGVSDASADDSLGGSGAVYVFKTNGLGDWKLDAFLKASAPDVDDGFGISVAIHDGTIVVGASAEDSAATGVDGDDSNDSAPSSGAAYVYFLDDGQWIFGSYLKASNTNSLDRFGLTVAIDDGTIVVGANGESSAATVVNGSQNDNSAAEAGAAYVFVGSQDNWSQQAYLKAANADAGDKFGGDVAIEGDVAVIGAKFEDSGATGVNGNPFNNSLPSAGAAYAFRRAGTTWGQVSYLKPPSAGFAETFGDSVAISGGVIVVGCTADDSGSSGTGGDPTDNSVPNSGAIHLFEPAGLSHAPSAFLKATISDDQDLFGSSVDMAGEVIVGGTRREDGDGSSALDDSASNAGAACAFEFELWRTLPGCFGNPATIRAPQGPARLATTFPIEFESNAIASGVAATFYGAVGIDAGGCGLLLGVGQEALMALAPFPTLIGVVPFALGDGTQPLPIPNEPSLVGIRLTFQSVLVDITDGSSELSRGLEVIIRP